MERMTASNAKRSMVCRFGTLLLALGLLFPPMPTHAAEPEADPPADFNSWTQDLDRAERALDGGELRPEDLEAVRERIRTLIDALQVHRAKSQKELEASRKLLSALGPPPVDGAPGEAPEIKKERRQLQAVVTGWEGKVKQADLLLERADTLINQVNLTANRAKAAGLLTRTTSPLSPERLAVATDGLQVLYGITVPAIGMRVTATWSTLAATERTILGAALAGSLVLALLPPILRHRSRTDPKTGGSAGRRATSLTAVRTAGLNIVVHCGAVALIWLSAYRIAAQHQAPLPLLHPLMVLLLCTVIAIELLRAPLLARNGAPAFPIRIALARGLARRLVLIVGIVASGIAVGMVAPALALPTPLVELSVAALQAIAAVVLIFVIRGRVWRELAAVRRGGGALPAPVRIALDALPAIRLFLALPLASPLLTLIGYGRFAEFLLLGVVGSGLVFWTYWLLRNAQREGLAMLLRRRRHRARRGRLVQAAVFAMADIGLALLALAGLAVAWGVDLTQIADWAGGMLGGVTVGSVTISFTTIATASGAFLAVLLLTRATQHTLDRRILRRAQVDFGTRNSLRTGTGYLGVILALLVALLALGLDLSKLALIAGALSIGVGFGLQTIANNFISGLILLIERPIKAGDWVVVGDQEGIVRRISVRATEIETFQRSSVLVPNAELISRSVVNWTFKDHTGRIDVTLKLDDLDDADSLLRAAEDAARRHPGVLSVPPPRALLRTGAEYELVLQLWAFINVKDSSTKFRIETELLADMVRERRKNRPRSHRARADHESPAA